MAILQFCAVWRIVTFKVTLVTFKVPIELAKAVDNLLSTFIIPDIS